MFDALRLSFIRGEYAYLHQGKVWEADVIGAGTKIYRVRIMRQAPALNGVFADAGDRQVLVSYGKEPLPSAGDLVYVYEVEAPKGNKLAVCKPHPSLAGEYVLYDVDGRALRFARAVPQVVRERCTETFPFGVGCLVRSKVGLADIPAALAELVALKDGWRQKVTDVGVGLVHQSQTDYREHARRAKETWCDDEALCVQFGWRYVENLPSWFDLEVAPALRDLGTRMTAQEGVELVIEHTEACTVIDVNGKAHALGLQAKNAAFSANLVAADEVLRQLCLRNVTGMILVDFISMHGISNKMFMEYLKEKAAVDERVRVVDMTQLGLVELTRSAT